jgi:endoglucanase
VGEGVRVRCLAAVAFVVAWAGLWPSSAGALAVSVRGNQLVDGAGETVRFLGVNRSGTEYACSEGWGLFDSPHPGAPDDADMIDAIRSWDANAVRVPLNEACWLGINGVKSRYTKRRYRDAIASYVASLEEAGLHPILDLHVVSPGRFRASHDVDHLRPMPDRGHALPFWRSVARHFGDDPAVVFDLYNEPHDVGWRCLLRGCRITHETSPATHKRAAGRSKGPNYRAVGMQRLVEAIRRQGAINVIMVPGVDWSGNLSRWLRYAPHDPLGRIAASFHNYEGPDLGSCHLECWERTVAPVAARVPVVSGEIGDVDCDHDYIDGFMSWADEHGVSYLGWSWNATNKPGGATCEGGPALIVDYDGTPTDYGVGLRDHLRALR